MTDIHAYRPAIADDCLIGVCSMNNCLFPACTKPVTALDVEHVRLLQQGWHLDPDGCYRKGENDGI